MTKLENRTNWNLKAGTLKPLSNDWIPLWNKIIVYFKTWNFKNANIALQTEFLYLFIYLWSKVNE